MDETDVVQALEDELFRLRESTKAALKVSWDEVELLQQQCSTHVAVTNSLAMELDEMRKKEEEWRVRCLAAEAKIQKSSEMNSESQTTRTESLRDNMLTCTANSNLNRNSMTEESSLETEPTLETEKFSHSIPSGTSSISCNSTSDRSNQELMLKISSRDEAIASLEETLNQHVKSMQTMQAEMQCLMQSQQIKQKNMTDSHRRKEERLNKIVESLRKKTEMKDLCVKEHQQKLSNYRIYIEELTGELEKVLKFVHCVENNSDDSLSKNSVFTISNHLHCTNSESQ